MTRRTPRLLSWVQEEPDGYEFLGYTDGRHGPGRPLADDEEPSLEDLVDLCDGDAAATASGPTASGVPTPVHDHLGRILLRRFGRACATAVLREIAGWGGLHGLHTAVESFGRPHATGVAGDERR